MILKDDVTVEQLARALQAAVPELRWKYDQGSTGGSEDAASAKGIGVLMIDGSIEQEQTLPEDESKRFWDRALAFLIVWLGDPWNGRPEWTFESKVEYFRSPKSLDSELLARTEKIVREFEQRGRKALSSFIKTP